MLYNLLTESFFFYLSIFNNEILRGCLPQSKKEIGWLCLCEFRPASSNAQTTYMLLVILNGPYE